MKTKQDFKDFLQSETKLRKECRKNAAKQKMKDQQLPFVGAAIGNFLLTRHFLLITNYLLKRNCHCITWSGS